MNENSARKSIADMAPVIAEIVGAGGSVRLDVKGTSMMPLLRSEKDAVLLKKPDSIHRFDVVLFKKSDGRIALHRIVKFKNNTYTIIGDNQYTFDRKIQNENLIAKAVQFQRGKLLINEKQIRAFGAVWYATYPLRKFLRKVISWIKRHSPACIRSLRNKFR